MADINKLLAFNGEPSIKLKDRPFISIVIPCYESKHIGRLLESIKKQKIKQEIEVIIADDRSQDLSYLDIVNKYTDDLSIKTIQTDYNCMCPGNTRERGVSIAEGVWINFADHDDEFIPYSLDRIKEKIIQSKEKYLCVANFYIKDPETERIVEKKIATRNWCHAKFFNMDNLWKPFNVHFKKDLLSHEDIYITTYTSCCLYSILGEDKPTYIDDFCYYWNVEPNSLSRRDYGGRKFIEVFYGDYLEATGEVYLSALKEKLVTPKFAYENCVATILYLYFYLLYAMDIRPYDYLEKNIFIAKDFIYRVKHTFKNKGEYITNQDILNLIYKKYNGAFWTEIKKKAECTTGSFEPKINFKDWLNLIDITINTKKGE